MAKLKRQIVIRPREKRGTWELDYVDNQGKRRRPVFATEELALARAAEVSKTLLQTVPVVADPYVTLADYTIRWLQGGQEIDQKTLASYTQLLNLHVLPVLGSIKLRDLHRRHVKELLAAKRVERLPPEAKMCARTRRSRRDGAAARIREEHGQVN